MPSRSTKQARFMRAVAKNPEFAEKVGVPTSVGAEFMKADKMKGKSYAEGGMSSYDKRKMKGKSYAKGGMSSYGKRKMAKGGKVRGCGKAMKGVRRAKMM